MVLRYPTCPYAQIDGVAMGFLWALREPTCPYKQK